jgi:hypothetical protein
VYEISLMDCLEPSRPPERVLTLSVVDDTVFLQIEKVEEDGESTQKTKVAEISVSSASLAEALDLLRADRQREDLRPVENEKTGNRGARYAGTRQVWVRA